MKKKIRKAGLVLLAVAMLIACIPANAFAAEIVSQYTGDDYSYTLDSDGLLVFSGKGYQYEEKAYQGRSEIRSVIIGSGPTSLARCFFEECENLESISLPDSLEVLGQYCFNNCKSLKEIKLPPEMESIQQGTFSRCKSLSKVTLSDELTWIAPFAFSECTSLKSIVLPSKVKTLYFDCFGESGLETIWIPVSVETIESSVFAETNLKDVYYAGTEAQWKQISIGSDNAKLTGAKIHFNQPVPQTPFTDVKDSEYYVDPVKWALRNDITKGTSDTTFSPDATCTRGQVVTFLWRAAGQPEPKSTVNPFTDVKASDYFYKPVLWAVENKVTSGISATKFGANDPCSRAQVVTFQHRAAGTPEPNSKVNPFTDVKADAYYNKAVLWAVENGITSGISATAFGPDESCTRAQIVTFLYRQFKPEVRSLTVTFESNGGTAVPKQTIKYGRVPVKPADPTKEGFEFAGWYTDEALTKAYGFQMGMISSCTLYAKWTEIDRFGIGETFTFGRYEQDNNTANGKEAIEWIVIDATDSQAVLMSKYVLDARAYDPGADDITWEKCELRSWLNSVFYNAAFSAAEKNRIVTSSLTAEKGLSGTVAGNNTNDKVYIPSKTEYRELIDGKIYDSAAATPYAIEQGASQSHNYTVYGKPTTEWWLRTPGKFQFTAVYVNDAGFYDANGDTVDMKYGIRPVIRINKQA